MVRTSTVQTADRALASAHDASGLVCVFVGATSGIGLSTVTALLNIAQHSTFYIVGRSEKRFASQMRAWRATNRSCRLVFLEAQVSLLSEVDAACAKVTEAEERVDILYMSPGYLPVGPRQYSEEGLDLCFALSYYCRIRFISQLLPALRASHDARVLSVLNGGNEKRILLEDLDLSRSGKHSLMAVVNHTTTMTSLALEQLARQEPDIAFLHSYPGWVKTDIIAHIKRALSSSSLAVFLPLIMAIVELALFLLGTPLREAGERQVYHLTDHFYRRPVVNRVRRIGWLSDEVLGGKSALQHEDQSIRQCVWEHTMQTFDGII